MISRRGILVISLLVLSGCGGMSPSQLGQALGTIAGSAIAPGVGTPIGALVGTLAGLVVEGEVDKGREKKERVELNQQLNGARSAKAGTETSPPGGTPTRVWVDEQWQEGRLIAGHFESRPLL